MKRWIPAFSLILGLGWGAPVIMAQVYKYTDDEGLVRYTDKVEQIPSHLKDAAEVQEKSVTSSEEIQSPAVNDEIRKISRLPHRKRPLMPSPLWKTKSEKSFWRNGKDG